MKIVCSFAFGLLVCATGLFAQTIEPLPMRTMGVSGNVETMIYVPAVTGPTKAALVLHTSSGLRDADHRYAQKLAGEGYVVVVPAFMKAYGIIEETRRHTWTTYGKHLYADFLSIITAVSQEYKITKEGFYAVGFSNGGHWAALLAARGDVQGGVSYYGAFSEGGADTSLSTFREAVTSRSHPVLILHGTHDAVVSSQYAVTLEGLYRREGAPVSAHYFHGAGHSFERRLGITANQAAATESWRLALKFLQEN